MTASILSGEHLASKMKQELKENLNALRKSGINPRVTAVHNPKDPAVRVYMRMQKKACTEMGIDYAIEEINPPMTEDNVIDIVSRLNTDRKVTGITVHLPLPSGINANKILRAISPSKDIEATHPYNLGMLAFGDHKPSPCAATAGVELLKSVMPSLKGLNAVIVGRSAMIGKAVTMLLLQSKTDAPTPTICHTATVDLSSYTRKADILFSAAGRANLIRGDMIKPGAMVIDIGVNELDGKIVGDVNFDEAKEVAGWITPVPSGVGPVTLAVFIRNICECAKLQSDAIK